MKQLSVDVEVVRRADVEVLWSLISDATAYPTWGPWREGGYQSQEHGPSWVGSLPWFRNGRHATSVEEILEVDAPRHLAYKVVSGLPVKNYRANVTLTPLSPTGTSIRWSATFDGTLGGRLVRRRLLKVYEEVSAALVGATNEQIDRP